MSETGTSDEIDEDVTELANNYALVFEKVITVLGDGNYTFTTASDDGSRLLLNDITIVDNDGIHNVISVSNTVFLEAGQYELRVEYFENAGGQVLNVTHAFEDEAAEEIPADGIIGTVSNAVVGDFVNSFDVDYELLSRCLSSFARF